jgi:hypothetical protein
MLLQLILADFRERTRRYSFLVTLTFVFFFGLLVITGKFGVYPNECRGELNSAWVGTSMAIGATVMAFMVGFYLVKNSIKRDKVTGVGQILATSSLSNTSYLYAKFLSNVLSLLVMTGVLVIAAVLMQLLGTQPWDLQLWKLLSPFLFITVPAIVLIAATAVLFETVRPLSGGFGNVLYFFLCPLWFNPSPLSPLGVDRFMKSMQAAARVAYPDHHDSFATGFVAIARKDTQSFPLLHWDGVDWTAAIALQRFTYVVLALVIVLVAVPFFDRFNTALRTRKTKAKTNGNGDAVSDSRRLANISASTLPPVSTHFGFFGQVRAELLLMFARVSWIWRIGALALLVLQLTLPFEIVRSYILPAAWIWPLLLWSSLGARERIAGTESLVFSSAHPLSRQLPAIWIAGLALTLLTGSGAVVRALLAGDPAYLATLLIAGSFIPTAALALGILSGGSQLFEITYVFLWYVGPINRMPVVDFLGATSAGVHSLVPTVFLLITLALIPVILFARRRQLGV